jgi:predicted HTH domain antitoxin
MSLVISDEIIETTKMSEKGIFLEFALWLYAGEKFTLGQASALVQLSQYEFQQELGKRKIPVHYGVEELREDIVNLGLPVQ